MNVASLELCKTLFELSGWDDTCSAWDVSDREDMPFENVVKSDEVVFQFYPAYDLGYLLRKLPAAFYVRCGVERMIDGKTYRETFYSYYRGGENEIDFYADTPEDAACKLAIELFKQGILEPTQTPGGKEE